MRTHTEWLNMTSPSSAILSSKKKKPFSDSCSLLLLDLYILLKPTSLHLSLFSMYKKISYPTVCYFSFVWTLCELQLAMDWFWLCWNFSKNSIGPGTYFDVLCASACQDYVIKICLVLVFLICILLIEYGARTAEGWC